MQADSRPGIPLPARSVRDAVCEAMGSAVPEGFRPQASPSSPVAAGADEPESVAVDRVAAEPAVFDTDAASSYRDGVEHDEESVFLSALRNMPPPPGWTMGEIRGEEGHLYLRGAASDALALEAEGIRQSRLARWQRQP